MKLILSHLILLGGAVLAGSWLAPRYPQPGLETIKSMAGTWHTLDDEGKPSAEPTSIVRCTAGGSTVIDTLFPGTEKEMVTLYHQDGDQLVLTHYCVLGNRPRMVCQPDSTATKLHFVCDCRGSIKDERHMHEGTLELDAEGHIQSTWTMIEKDEVVMTEAFHLVRADG